jgi:hypothetical protein
MSESAGLPPPPAGFADEVEWTLGQAEEFVLFWFLCVGSYAMWRWVHRQLSESIVRRLPVSYDDDTPEEAHRAMMATLPLRFFHCFHMALSALAYPLHHLDLVLYVMRIVNTAYFVYDCQIVVASYWRAAGDRPWRTKLLHMIPCFQAAPPADDEEDEDDEDDVPPPVPFMTLLHHAVTVTAFFGHGQDNRSVVLELYMSGSIAVLVFQMVWFCCQLPWLSNRISDRRLQHLKIASCWIYFYFRPLKFTWDGARRVLPSIEWGWYSTSMVLLDVLLLAINWKWWFGIVAMTYDFEWSTVWANHLLPWLIGCCACCSSARDGRRKASSREEALDLLERGQWSTAEVHSESDSDGATDDEEDGDEEEAKQQQEPTPAFVPSHLLEDQA